MKTAMDILRFVSSHPLTRDAPLKAMARVVSWQIKSRLQGEIIVPWIANQKLAVRRGMRGATGNIYVGLHEFPDMMFLLHFLRDGDLFFDIGANVGTYSILASGVCKAHTWAFEPDPTAVISLKRNVEINGLQELIKVHECALGPTEREVTFTTGLDTVNRIATPDDRKWQLVRQERLDSLIGNFRPTFSKLDVEGYELEVLRGGRSFLAADSLQAIQLETITTDTEDLLSEFRFARAFYDPFKRMLSTEPVGLRSFNALFVKDFNLVSTRIVASRKIRVLDQYF
jgi:FkbM family methyltransferase